MITNNKRHKDPLRVLSQIIGIGLWTFFLVWYLLILVGNTATTDVQSLPEVVEAEATTELQEVAELEAVTESEAVAEPEAVTQSEVVTQPEAIVELEAVAELETVVEPEAVAYTKEEVLMLGDAMTAEGGIFLSTLPDEDAEMALKLIGSVILRRVEVKLDGAENMTEVIFSKGYGSRTQSLIGNIDTPDEVYQWAEELLRDGAIGPRNLLFQAEFIQGPIYAVYGNEEIGIVYFCTSPYYPA